MMRGCCTTAAGITNYKVASLYNNSTAAELLCLWTVVPNTASGKAPAVARSGSFGSLGEVVNTLVSGGARLAGQIFVSDEAAVLTNDFEFFTASAIATYLQAGVPIAILQPGWSFSVSEIQTGQTGTQVSFLWQSIHPEDLEDRHCYACDGAPAASP